MGLTLAVIAIVGGIIWFYNRHRKSAPVIPAPDTTKKLYQKHIYDDDVITIELAGVHHRADVFATLKNGQVLRLQFEPTNPYDKNAIAVFTSEGKLVGYLPRNQRKIIRTLKEKRGEAIVRAKSRLANINGKGEYLKVIVDITFN